MKGWKPGTAIRTPSLRAARSRSSGTCSACRPTSSASLWSSTRAAGIGARASALSSCDRGDDVVARHPAGQRLGVEAGVERGARDASPDASSSSPAKLRIRSERSSARARSGACSRAATTARQAGSDAAIRGRSGGVDRHPVIARDRPVGAGELLGAEAARSSSAPGLREHDHPHLPLEPVAVEPVQPLPERLGRIRPRAGGVGVLRDQDVGHARHPMEPHEAAFQGDRAAGHGRHADPAGRDRARPAQGEPHERHRGGDPRRRRLAGRPVQRHVRARQPPREHRRQLGRSRRSSTTPPRA